MGVVIILCSKREIFKNFIKFFKNCVVKDILVIYKGGCDCMGGNIKSWVIRYGVLGVVKVSVVGLGWGFLKGWDWMWLGILFIIE